MSHFRTRAVAATMIIAVTGGALLASAGAAPAAPTRGPAGGQGGSAAGFCSPVGPDRVVCPAAGPDTTVAFIDPAADIRNARRVKLGAQVYVAPFAVLAATRHAGITIGAQSNVEDSAVVTAVAPTDRTRAAALAKVGLSPRGGVVMAERTVLGHDAVVKGPVRIGLTGTDIPANPDGEQEVILNQGAEVDGAVLEKNTAVSALARVGPGVILRSGMAVLPGRNVTTQQEADDPALGKVVPLTEADVDGTELSIDANTAFARDYARLARTNPNNVRGINLDPGGNPYSGQPDLPVTDADSGTCEGIPTQRPNSRNRVIGKVCLEDTVREFERATGERISLRSDEGADAPYIVGRIGHMHDRVVFHDVPDSRIVTGDGVVYGEGSTVHSAPGADAVLGDGVVLGADSVVFGANLGDKVKVGEKALVGFGTIPAGTVIAPRSLVFFGETFGQVEW